MEIIYSKDFIKSVRLLPEPIKTKLVRLLEILKNNHFDSRLHTKPLVGELKGFYSFRITRDWRVIFNFRNGKTIILIDAANRKDIYK